MKDFLYSLINNYGKFILLFTYKRIDIEGKEKIPKNKALLYASTHFNSFYDSIITHLRFDKKIHALARGDAFKNKWAAKFLDTIYILPIWRISEGKSNMVKNKKTFEKCHEVLKEGEKVLIYAEGICKNQTDVLPLKIRGTADIAFKAWNENIDMAIIPMVLTYDNYKKFGKVVNVRINDPIYADSFDLSDEKEFSNQLSDKLFLALKEKVNYDFKPYNFISNPVYFIGWLINFPLYLALSGWMKKKFGKTVFFHSIWFGCLYLLLPFYWLLLILILSLSI